jgi:hypothetical protein
MYTHVQDIFCMFFVGFGTGKRPCGHRLRHGSRVLPGTILQPAVAVGVAQPRVLRRNSFAALACVSSLQRMFDRIPVLGGRLWGKRYHHVLTCVKLLDDYAQVMRCFADGFHNFLFPCSRHCCHIRRKSSPSGWQTLTLPENPTCCRNLSRIRVPKCACCLAYGFAVAT